MYSHLSERSIEPVCYELEHIEKVISIIESNFLDYFDDFIKLEAGHAVSSVEIEKAAKKIGVQDVKKKEKSNLEVSFKQIIAQAIEEFEKDREKYQAIFDQDALKEYDDDPQYFKSTVLKKECPVIHSTIFNKQAKVLDKYRRDFKISDPKELLIVVTNLCEYAQWYNNEFYDSDGYDLIETYHELELEDLDTENYSVYGVIGGGIKSHMLYKIFPSLFPNRSRSAIWALWYLTGKSKFDCEYDSEFLMIDVEKSITQQNYFYPYELFGFYAYRIFQLLNQKATDNNVYLDPQYRYIYVDAFLTFVAKQHENEISFFGQQIKDGGWSYA